MSSKRVFIIHGYSASPEDHWFPWLKNTLERDGIVATVLKMPNSKAPEASAWIECIQSNVSTPDANTYFVAHSLGCIALLRYLDSLSGGTKIGGMVLVSGFSETLPQLPELDGFVMTNLKQDHLITISSQRTVIASFDDPSVPYEKTERLSVFLKANLRSVQSGGHFLATDGFTEFPEVYEELTTIIKKCSA
jgi:uncharacterized protein